MTHSILDLLRNAVVHYGYWAVGVALLLENAGVPLPGETILLMASFLAYSEHDLRLPWIIVVATVVTTVGGSLGFALGQYGGRPLLERYQRVFRIRQTTVARGEVLFEKYGSVTIFFARFVFGMRLDCRAAGGSAAHAVAKIPGVEFSGRDGLGDGDFRRGIFIWPALGTAGAVCAKVRRWGRDFGGAGGGVVVVAQVAGN